MRQDVLEGPDGAGRGVAGMDEGLVQGELRGPDLEVLLDGEEILVDPGAFDGVFEDGGVEPAGGGGDVVVVEVDGEPGGLPAVVSVMAAPVARVRSSAVRR
ncbi:hypothetical protein [Streptomyces clavuligerus]|uniref:hypothetical protein n=1 Tax=Streptomyces clavuligerus TaxID=1901 RepID=UPI0018C8EF73|nr:hypothetical protein [Streptomyces clavuligerus]